MPRASGVAPPPQPAPLSLQRARARMRAGSAVPGGRRGGAGLPALAGRTVPPFERSRLLLGQLTSNEEQAGREGRVCGGACTARRTGGRERRGHVTAVVASGRPPSWQPEPPGRAAAPKQLPARKQELRAHPPPLAPGPHTCDLRAPPPPPPHGRPGPACGAVSSFARTPPAPGTR